MCAPRTRRLQGGRYLAQGQLEGQTRRWRDDTVEQQGTAWTRTAKDRECWRTLAESYFLQVEDNMLE